MDYEEAKQKVIDFIWSEREKDPNKKIHLNDISKHLGLGVREFKLTINKMKGNGILVVDQFGYTTSFGEKK